MKIDMLITNANVYNSYLKKFMPSNVAIVEGKFYYIGERGQEFFSTDKVMDAKEKYIIPGLIDIHLHIESTMVTPATFSYGIIKNGVTTIVPEPHEMANVFGVSGVKEMMKASRNCVADMFYAIPSSVPATTMETTGGSIEIEDIDELLQTGEMKCLGEIMNFYDVITDPKCKTNQILNHIKTNYPDLIIEGHVPKLLDLELQQMIVAGVNSDHTHQTIEGMQQRIAAGMFLEIQEKSMTQEIIEFLTNTAVAEHFCFVTDDVMPDYFQKYGQLNHLLKKAIQMGMTPEQAIYACTYTPAKRMQMHDRGIIAAGKIADFLLVSDLESFTIEEVYKDGEQVYHYKQPYQQTVSEKCFPESFYRSIVLNELTAKDFEVPLELEDGSYPCRIIEVNDGSTFTKEIHDTLSIFDRKLDWERSEYGLIATFERYGKNGNRAHGLISGDIIKRGAIATTYSHDNHNLLVIGHNVEDMVLAANEVIRSQGGICCVENGEVLSRVPLPVGGILSEEPLEILAEQVDHLTLTLKSLGYKHYNVIMSISTLSLPVSPAIKITDRGLISVNEGKFVPLVINQ
ncbi:adenine deaminase C-terminal domain-containing protein [Peribacillus huizhouensis]|uniref:Adenine deaminase n=1 Tax=Peribacillus huizhouensis TaxID=1501239 RepID=A0ABR6CJ77_9BACI|nr:adenine deaminase C-terminal domain-containing protein [Peribacillus huizhouensis]MBA9025118.1 adenine deaminase [Peribacillus huizhouensis]